MLVIALTLAAAFLFALATAVQQSAAMGEHEKHALRLRLLWNLVRRPRWLLGMGLDLSGFCLQALALALGELVVVQPLLVTTLLFALPIGARVSHQMVGAREAWAALAVAVGLLLYMAGAAPTPGALAPTPGTWSVALVITAGGVATLGLLGRRSRAGLRAALLGSGAGILFGVTAAFTKTIVELPSLYPSVVLATPYPWMMAVTGLSGMLFMQSALQAGALAPALAAVVTIEPLAAAAVGVIVLGERFGGGRLGAVAVAIGTLLILGGIVELVRSSRAIRLLQGESAEHLRRGA